jgi:hypothetical protein
MATSPIRIELGTEPGQHRIDAGAFLSAIDAELEILTELDRELTGGKIEWFLTHLEIGSGIAIMEGDWALLEGDPLIEDAARRRALENDIPRLFIEGIRTLDQEQDTWPRAFSGKALDAAERLASVLKDRQQDRVISIRVSAPKIQETAVVSERLIANVKALSVQRFRDIGAVEGTLVSVSMARRPYTFSVRDPIHQRLIPCSFRLEHLETVRDALMKRVSVRGYITYSEDGVPVRLSAIESLAVLEPAPRFDPTRFFGLDREFTDGLPAAEFVRRGWRDREG